MLNQGKQPARLAMGAMCFRDRPFPAILDAAAASGFEGIGLSVGQCVSALERGIPLEDISQLLSDRGLRLAELELVRLCDNGPSRFASMLVEDLARELKPDRVHTAAFVGDDLQVRDEFAALCSRLSDVPVAVEFMPYNKIPDTTAALALVESSGLPNARIVLDVVHFFRSGGVLADLTPTLLDKVAGIQLSDVSVRGGIALAHEARHLRTYPGRGNLDIVGFLRSISEAVDVLPPISVEPISDAIEQIQLSVVAEESMFGTLQVLDAAHCELREGWFMRQDCSNQ